MVMMFASPFRAVVTITTGPGSSRRYTLDKEKDLFDIVDHPLKRQEEKPKNYNTEILVI
jgi:hypothetical protein